MRICVFCSSKLDFPESTLETCRLFSRWMADQGHSLVYGGARVGMMGLVADEVLARGQKVIGYMPKGLFPSEIPHTEVTELVEVEDLFERKRLMMEASDAFVILPGGVGTLDEFFEVITWKSLRCFDKPVIVYNVNGFWNSLISLMTDLQSKNVLDKNLLGCFKVCETLEDVKRSL